MSGNPVAQHYTHGALLDAIRAGIAALGKTPETVTVDDLGPVDEFHIGGRLASEHFLGQLALDAAAHVLDIGCGLGGGARFTVSRYGARVTGIDLTPEYVETGRALCHWVGLDDRIELHQGSALEMPFAPESFDAAYMMHVGMNIADKRALFAEVARVLRPGGRFGIYDIMRTGEGDLEFPVPWAMNDESSKLAAPSAYRDALHGTGFTVTAEEDRRQFALDFFAAVAAKTAQAGGPPPLGLHVLMGKATAQKVPNMVANVANGLIAPVEIIARKG